MHVAKDQSALQTVLRSGLRVGMIESCSIIIIIIITTTNLAPLNGMGNLNLKKAASNNEGNGRKRIPPHRAQMCPPLSSQSRKSETLHGRVADHPNLCAKSPVM